MRTPNINTKTFDKYVEQLLKEWNTPGAAIGIVDGDETIVKSYGYADLEKQRPIDDRTLFDTASTAKSFTAAAVALVMEDGEQSKEEGRKPFSWNTPVSSLLPEDFAMADPLYTAHVTVEDILSHRSGLGYHDDAQMGIASDAPDNPQSITRRIRHLPITRPLRTEHQYCNLMYSVAAYLVEKLSGMTFAQFIKQRIFEPLEMNESFMSVVDTELWVEVEARTAIGYAWSEETNAFKLMPFYAQPEGVGQGCVFSTVSDYAKWLRCMLRKSAPLSESIHDELRKPRCIANPSWKPKWGLSHELYALGWEVKSYRGHTIMSHDGGWYGFHSTMKYLPDFDWGISVFANGDEGADDFHMAVAYHIIDEVLGVPQEQRLDWSKVLREQLEEWKQKKEEKQSGTESPATAEERAGMDLPLEDLAGRYFHAGYHYLNVQAKDDGLFIDARDRGSPLDIFIRKGSDRFTGELVDALNGYKRDLPIRFELDASTKAVKRLGVGFEEDMGDDVIWFDKVANYETFGGT